MPATLPKRASRPPVSLRQTFPELTRGTADLIAAIKAGLPTGRLDALRASLDVSAAEIAALLGIPPTTLARRRASGRLGPGESERAYRVASLLQRAADVFGSLEAARAWLKRPQLALGGVAPLAFADTEPGAREVEDLLGRIEHGIPA